MRSLIELAFGFIDGKTAMGEIREQRDVLAIMAVASRYEPAIDQWARNHAVERWGPVAIESQVFNFDQTSFYSATMGGNLKKKLFAFSLLIDPARLSELKIESNSWELEFNTNHDYPEERPINIDPGYLTEAKLVLATTKDRDHRIYLRDGIFAEVTLFFQRGVWQNLRWTYPDYQTVEYHEFFDRCRQYLRSRYAS